MLWSLPFAVDGLTLACVAVALLWRKNVNLKDVYNIFRMHVHAVTFWTVSRGAGATGAAVCPAALFIWIKIENRRLNYHFRCKTLLTIIFSFSKQPEIYLCRHNNSMVSSAFWDDWVFQIKDDQNCTRNLFVGIIIVWFPVHSGASGTIEFFKLKTIKIARVRRIKMSQFVWRFPLYFYFGTLFW
jgi:hypothetical protein